VENATQVAQRFLACLADQLGVVCVSKVSSASLVLQPCTARGPVLHRSRGLQGVHQSADGLLWLLLPCMQAGAFKIGDTAGTLDNIIACKLYRPGSVGFVSKSGGMSNEMYNVLSRATDGLYEGTCPSGRYDANELRCAVAKVVHLQSIRHTSYCALTHGVWLPLTRRPATL